MPPLTGVSINDTSHSIGRHPPKDRVSIFTRAPEGRKIVCNSTVPLDTHIVEPAWLTTILQPLPRCAGCGRSHAGAPMLSSKQSNFVVQETSLHPGRGSRSIILPAMNNLLPELHAFPQASLLAYLLLRLSGPLRSRSSMYPEPLEVGMRTPPCQPQPQTHNAGHLLGLPQHRA